MRNLDMRDEQRNDEFLSCLLERMDIALEEIAKLPAELRESHDSSFWGESAGSRKSDLSKARFIS